MPNGKGTLDCSYCTHFRGRGLFHEPAQCAFHGVPIPPSPFNRICVHFDAGAAYYENQGPGAATTPPARRFTWFREDLEAGVLYEFMYNTPNRIERRTTLRVFDYQRREWARPADAT